MTKVLLRGLSLAIWVSVIALLGDVYYLNHYTPRGPMYETGDSACLNDGQGPCGPEVVEDVRKLAIPDWEKTLKRYWLLIVIPLAMLGAFTADKAKQVAHRP